MSFSTAKRDFSMPKKKKKKVNLGSKARRLLKHSQKQQQQQKSESASIDDDDEDTKKQQQSELELEFRTKNPPPKTQKKSSGEQLDPYRFVYDESEDEELKRLRAVHANPSDDDDVTMLLTQKWAPVDVDASDAMLGNAEDGFMSLEVLVDVDTREDAKTSKTSKTT